MKSSEILRAFADAGQHFSMPPASDNGYQPDISAVLEAIRDDKNEIPAAVQPEHERKLNPILLWICGMAACAVIVFTAVMFANRGRNLRDPETSVNGSLPVHVMTNTTSAPSGGMADRDIPFTVSAADYQDDEAFLPLNEQEALRSCMIRSLDDLKANRIQPKKEYNENYFKDHVLIFVSTVFTCTGDPPEVTKVHTGGSTIEVTAERKTAEAEALQWWCTFIEADKTDVPVGDAAIILHSDTQIKKPAEMLSTERDIQYSIVLADYQITDSNVTYNDLKNMVFYDAESLNRSYVHPEKEYDDAFFQDHALLFVTYVFSTMNQYETTVSSIHRTDNTITVNAVRVRDETETSAVQWWCAFFEVQKADLPAGDAEIILHIDQPLSQEMKADTTDVTAGDAAKLLPVDASSVQEYLKKAYPYEEYSPVPFKIVEADHAHYNDSLSMEELKRKGSRIIYSMDALKKCVIQPVKEYSEEYFKDHALIFLTRVFARIGDPTIENIQVYRYTEPSHPNEPVTGFVEVNTKRDLTGTAEENWWCVFCEVDRADLHGEPTYLKFEPENPRDVDAPTPRDVRMVRLDDARIPDIQNILGEWGGEYVDDEPSKHYLVKEDGTFTYTDDTGRTQNTSGSMTVKDGGYVFRFSDDCTIYAEQDAEDPLNVLWFEDKENRMVFRRIEDDCLVYERQFTSVSETDFDGMSLKEMEGEWFGATYPIRFYDCSKLTGSFEWSYEEFNKSHLDGDYCTFKGKVRVEQGIDNNGNQQYYYNLYNEKSELLLSMISSDELADWEIGKNVKYLIVDYSGIADWNIFHFKSLRNFPYYIDPFRYDSEQPFAFVLGVKEESSDEEDLKELHIESGKEWLSWYENEKANFYRGCDGSLTPSDQQQAGLDYVLNNIDDYDILWFRMKPETLEVSEARSVTFEQGCNVIVGIGTYYSGLNWYTNEIRICVPVPHSIIENIEDPVKSWRIRTVSQSRDDTGKPPEIKSEYEN